MNRQKCVALMVGVGLAFFGASRVRAAEGAGAMLDEANQSIAAASAAVENARAAIENGKQLLARIPDDSALLPEVKEVLVAAAANWKQAVKALEGAKASAARISKASTPEVAGDYKLLAEVNAEVALAGAKVVDTGLLFVKAVADNKTESLGVIRMAMQDALASASQVEFNYERVKALVAKKYSK